MLKDNASESSQSIVGNLIFICKAQEITIAVILCKYSHEIRTRAPPAWSAESRAILPPPGRPGGCCASTTQRSTTTSDPAAEGRAHADVGDRSPRKNWKSHIDASHSRQPLVKGERLVRYEVNAVMLLAGAWRSIGPLRAASRPCAWSRRRG